MAAIARFGSRVVPELPQIVEDCRRVAESLGIPLWEVYRAVEAATANL